MRILRTSALNRIAQRINPCHIKLFMTQLWVMKSNWKYWRVLCTGPLGFAPIKSGFLWMIFDVAHPPPHHVLQGPRNKKPALLLRFLPKGRYRLSPSCLNTRTACPAAPWSRTQREASYFNPLGAVRLAFPYS